VQLFNGKGHRRLEDVRSPIASRTGTSRGVLYSSGKKSSHLFSPAPTITELPLSPRVEDQRQGQQRQYFRTKFARTIPKVTKRKSTATSPTRKKPAACTTSPNHRDARAARHLVHARVIANGEPHPDLVNRQRSRRYMDAKTPIRAATSAIQQHGPAKDGPEVQVAIKKSKSRSCRRRPRRARSRVQLIILPSPVPGRGVGVRASARSSVVQPSPPAPRPLSRIPGEGGKLFPCRSPGTRSKLRGLNESWTNHP